MKLKSKEHLQTAKVLFKLQKADIVKGPDLAKDYIEEEEVTIAKLTEDKAFSVLTNARLTKYQYNIIRSNVVEGNCSLYLNYESIIKGKKRKTLLF